MIRVRIELVPFGDEDNAREIGQMVLANYGDGDRITGNYGYVYSDDHGDDFEGTIKGYPRNNGIWELISACLTDNVGVVDDKEFINRLWDRMN